MDKVALPKEVAKAIDRLRASGKSNMQIVADTLYGGVHPGTDNFIMRKFLQKDDLNDEVILSALVNGYAIEKTPEDRLREIYKNHTDKPSIQPLWNEGVTLGIEMALNTLGITIDGINA